MENAPSAIEMAPATLYSLLAGKKDWTTALMMGKILISGDANYTIMVGVLVNNFRRSYKTKGIVGVLLHLFSDKVLIKMSKK